MFKRMVLTALVSCALIGTVLALEYSAEIVTRTKGMTMTSKMYFSGDKIRSESEQAGRKMISIIRMDKKVSWSLMPVQKMYMEMAMPDDKMMMGMTEKAPGQVERKKIGREKVNGVDCDKYLVTSIDKTTGKKSSVYMWLSGDNIPMRTAAIDGSFVSEIKNFSKGPQPASLFEVPAGYKKQVMPAIPKGMPMMKGGKIPADYMKMMKQFK